VLDHPIPIGMTVSGQYYSPLLQDKVRLAVCCKHPELLEHGVILLRDIAIPHRQHCAKSGSTLGLEGVGTSSLLSRSCPMQLLVLCTCARTSSG